MPDLTLLQWFSLFWFAASWYAYGRFSGLQSCQGQRLQDALRLYIVDWVTVLQQRENRIVDTAAIANLERNATFFASSSLLVIAGLMTAINSSEQAITFLSNFVFIQTITLPVWELGIIMLIGVFAYSFFTFTWCLRQWGIASILVGSMPLLDAKNTDKAQQQRHGETLTSIISLAVYHFNLGLRSYYFSLALLTWFLHPLLFILTTSWVVAVLYRREFHSRTRKALVAGLPPCN